MNTKLARKVVIISGGAKGIGAAMTECFAKEGANVVILDKDEKSGLELVAKMNAEKFNVSLFVIDLGEESECEDGIRRVISEFGRIDVLVNNAGVNDGVGIEASLDDFVGSLQKNLFHYITLARLSWPHLKKSKGVIINIGSKVSVTGQGNTSGYAAAKGAIMGLTREWAIDGLPFEIRVNAILPAEVYTDAYRTWLEKTGNAKDLKKEIESKIPLGHRMTTPEEIANVAVFLASNKLSGHTTGQILFPDGGYVHLDRKI